VPSEYDISLNIRNNRNYAQTFNGMGGSVNPLDTSNATTEYRYNITTFNFTDENSITIYYKSVGQSVFSSFTAELPSQNPEGLVIALNGLGIGFFNTYVELGQTYLGTYNENYIFGSLDVYNSSVPTTTTTSTSTTTTTIFVPTTTTTSTTSTTTSLAPTTSTTSTTTSLAPTTTSTTTTTTSLAPTTTSTTTSTTTEAATTTSTTTSTTTEAATTTSTTTSTTTEAATTTSTTTSTTTEAATTTSTTTSTTTEAATTTSTTTTTTTLAFSGSVGYSGNDATVCFTPVATFTMTGNAGSFCASTIFTSASWGAVASGAYFIANGGNILPVNHILGENTATTSGACTACPITTTTTTTSTTSTTTTLPPTTTTTSTTTTTTTLAFSGSVGYSGNDATVCFTPVATFTMTGNAGSFCASTIFTSASWGAVASGAYFIANGGNILPVNHILGENTATTSGACTACPITTTTTTTTSTSTTSTSTTSTTTTLPPVTLSLTPGCAGGPGLGTILANNFSGGTGSFEYISISATSEAEALTNLDNPATRTFINGATEYTFTTLANSTYYVAIMDFSGNKGVNSTSVLCTTTTTTSTTTTTTTLAFSGSVGYSGNDATVCFTPVATFTMTGNAGSFCASTIFTSASWGAVASGAYFIANGGNILPVNHILGENTATTSGACTACPITTTTTSTTSTTTTLPGIAFGVSITTKYGTEFLACGGTVTGTRYQPPAFGNTPTDGAQLYTDSTLQTTWTPAEGAGLYLFQFGGSTKWAVFVGVTGIVGAVSDCSGVTTTTTTTSTTTTTTTAAPVAYTIDNGANGNPYGACVGSVPTSVVYAEPGNTVPIVGLILYTNQNLTTPFVGSAGWRKLVNPSSVAYAAEVNSSGEITNYVTCTSQTTTTTSTTTSTTTLPGIAFGVSITTKYGTEFLACGGTVTGVRYQPPAFGNTPTTEAQLYTDSTLQTTWTPSAGAGLYLFQFGGSTKWAVFVDATGIVGAVSACSGVTTTTTTTTSTTSTTTTIPIYMYLGNTNPIYSTFSAACQNYATIRPYYSTKSNLNLIGPTDIIYDSYPGSPTNGGNLWVALTSGGVDPKLGFQIGTDGAVITSGGNCPVLTTTTTTSSTTTTTTITTSTTTTTTSLGPTTATIDIATNNSLDIAISISGISVNGVTVTDVTGVDPNTPGNGGSCQTTQIGEYVVIVPYSASTPGQSITLIDSNSVQVCLQTNTGSDFLVFTGVTINTTTPVNITANEGICF
jgi:hypothetical protein